MSYHEALADGIPIEMHGGYNWYYPPCHICGSPVPSWNYLRNAKYACRDCKEILVEMHHREMSQESSDKKEKRLSMAIKQISKVADISEYEAAIKKVSEDLHNPGWFQSKEEVMVAIELFKNGVEAQHQVKIYDYSVDFVLPEYKVALEIDGAIFHGKDKEEREILRDELIVSKLGDGWEVIRIQTDNINTNVTKLLPAIRAVKKYRRNKTVH